MNIEIIGKLNYMVYILVLEYCSFSFFFMIFFILVIRMVDIYILLIIFICMWYLKLWLLMDFIICNKIVIV